MVGSGRMMRRSAVGVALVLLASLTILVAEPPAPAGAVTGGLRDYTLRYTNNANGQITMASNVSMQCPSDTVDPAINSACAGSRAGTNARNNNSYDMRWLDVDSDPSTFDSSSAQLVVPSSGRILFAGLYWTGIQKKGSVVTGANGFIGVPVAAPNEALIGTAKLKVPGSSSYSAVTASQVDTGPIANNSGYTAFADVTALVAGVGAGTYTVADVQTGTGGNSAAGWSLVVAYADQNEPLRNLSIFDGMKVVANGNSVSVNLAGFKTPSSGTVRTTIGVVAAEGDAGATGDYLTVNDQLLTDAIHPANNTENSTIANRGTQVSTKSPDWRNQLGYDASFFQADGFLGNGDTSATFAAKTTNDTYAPQAITFATELFSPDVNLTKTASVVGAGPAVPGATIRYSITATNNGLQNATNVELSDLIPSGTSLTGSPSVTAGSGNVTCAPGACSSSSESIIGHLGTGSTPSSGGILAPSGSVTVEFDVIINGDAWLGWTIPNVAELDFVSPDLGLPISKYASADFTVVYPDPGVVKTLRTSAGNRYTFDITVSNYGTISTSGSLEVTDTLGTAGSIVSIGGTGWNCVGLVCSRSDALAAGGSYPNLTVIADFTAGQPVLNTATLTGINKGGQPSDPNSRALINDEGSANGGTSPTSTLVVHKAAVGPVVSVGEESDFGIETYNSGPTTAVGATMHDVVPAGLRIVGVSTNVGSCSTAGSTVDCEFGDIAVGYAAFVWINVVPDATLAGTTVTNTATATSSTTLTPGSDSADLEIRPATDLSLTKTVDLAEVNPGDSVTYTLTATNIGTQVATDVQITDHLPEAMDAGNIVASTPGMAICDFIGSVVNCVWADPLGPGDSVTLTISLATNGVVPVDQRHAVNVAEVSSTTDDLDPSNDSAEALVKILPYADVEATATGSGVIDPNGDPTTLTFTGTNNGPSLASSAMIDIVIDAGLEVVSASPECTITGQAVSCSIGDLVAGTAFSVDVVVRAPNSTPGTTFISSVHAESDALDPIDPILGNNDDVTPLQVADPPVIDSLGPNEGPADGGTEVVIEGDSFTPESNVDIGGTPCGDVTYVSAQQLTCRTGPHDPGTVDVVVTNPDGQSSTLPGAFTYVGPEPEPVVPSFTG